MPQLIENEDGTTTLAINSSELLAVKNTLFEFVPVLKTVVGLVDGPRLGAVWGFVKSVVDG